jgi:RNase P protein component
MASDDFQLVAEEPPIINSKDFVDAMHLRDKGHERKTPRCKVTISTDNFERDN